MRPAQLPWACCGQQARSANVGSKVPAAVGSSGWRAAASTSCFKCGMRKVTIYQTLIPELQVYNNMLGDMDFFSDPASALANAVVKTNDQLHRAVRMTARCSLPCAQHPLDCLVLS